MGATCLFAHNWQTTHALSALQVWNWSEVHEERQADAAVDGAAGDYYYGGALPLHTLPTAYLVAALQVTTDTGCEHPLSPELNMCQLPGVCTSFCCAQCSSLLRAGAAQDCELDDSASLTDILTESINLAAGAEQSDLPQVTGDCAVGTTPLDASRWGLGRVVLAVGPERGWTDAELTLLQIEGFGMAGFGWRTLSSPVATLSAVAICQEALR